MHDCGAAACECGPTAIAPHIGGARRALPAVRLSGGALRCARAAIAPPRSGLWFDPHRGSRCGRQPTAADPRPPPPPPVGQARATSSSPAPPAAPPCAAGLPPPAIGDGRFVCGGRAAPPPVEGRGWRPRRIRKGGAPAAYERVARPPRAEPRRRPGARRSSSAPGSAPGRRSSPWARTSPRSAPLGRPSGPRVPHAV
jgi:hypothetical protein